MVGEGWKVGEINEKMFILTTLICRFNAKHQQAFFFLVEINKLILKCVAIQKLFSKHF